MLKKVRRKKEKKSTAVARTATVARRRQNGGKRSVFIQTEKQGDKDGQTATAENIRAENSVFRAEYEQSDENPKGGVPR